MEAGAVALDAGSVVGNDRCKSRILSLSCTNTHQYVGGQCWGLWFESRLS